MRDAINNAATDSDNDGTKDVLASIIYDGSNYMLMLKSESGASNEMKVTDSHSTPAYAYDTTDGCLLYTSPSPRDRQKSRMPSSA